MVKCAYCGEDADLVSIPNPNLNGEELFWMVCVTCKEVIKWQMQLSFASFLASRPYGGESANKLMVEAQENLERISREQKIPILSAQLSRQDDGSYDVLGVEYTGKGGFSG